MTDYVDQAGVQQALASLDGGRIVVIGCGEGCHVKGEAPLAMPLPMPLERTADGGGRSKALFRVPDQ